MLYPRFNTKNNIKWFLPFSMNSRPFVSAFHALLTSFFYIPSFAYVTALDDVSLFEITGPPNQHWKSDGGNKVKKKGHPNHGWEQRRTILALLAACSPWCCINMLSLKIMRKTKKGAFHSKLKQGSLCPVISTSPALFFQYLFFL